MGDRLDEAQLIAGLSRAFDAFHVDTWDPLPHQIPPPGRWDGWLLLAGRGAGKTDACSHYMVEHVKGPACLPGPAPHWMGIIAPDKLDAATSGFYGPSGIRAHDPTARLVSRQGGTVVIWPNGSECKLFGAHTIDDVDALRSGGNRCLMWLEELAAWRYLQEAFDHMTLGLRAGPWPRWIGSTTPKPRQLIKDLHDGKHEHVAVVTGVSTDDNPHLLPEFRAKVERRYGATALGAQELHGRIVSEDENALWHRGTIERFRIEPREFDLTVCRRIIVGVDPSGGADEQGIVVNGKGRVSFDREGLREAIDRAFVLADYTCRLDPEGWGDRVIDAVVDWQADEIVVERNFGGAMARSTIASAARARGVPIPIREVWASRGKRPRIEPISAIAARGEHPHVGVFEALEDQMCTWVPGESDYSPDRLDADAWGVTALGMVPTLGSAKGEWSGALLASRTVGR